MHEMTVSGEIKALAWKEGSSGVFSGAIEGLYQGYRLGSRGFDEQHHVMTVPHGSIALVLRQEIGVPLPLPSRPEEHPFAGGKDPLAGAPAPGGPPGPTGGMPGGPPAGMPGGGPPAGMPGGIPGGGPPGGPQAGGPPPVRPGMHGQVTLRIDPDTSTGIFAGATGEMAVTVPNYKIGGYLVVNTPQGDLHMTFLEYTERGTLNANLQVDGGKSTGIYRNARGDLSFSLAMSMPNHGRGRYQGTLWLEQEPPTR